MAEVDTSFYAKAQPNSFLDTANQAIGFANQAAQNKLLQTQGKQSQLDLVKDQVGQLVNGFSTLASLPDLTPGHFQQFGQRMVEEGIISPEIYQAEMKQVLASGGDPNALRQLATNYSLRALDAGQRFSAQYGTPSILQNGSYDIPVTISSLTGVNQIGAPIMRTLSPEQRAQPTTVGVTPEGQPITGTLGGFLGQQGLNPFTALPEQPQGNALMGGQANAPATPGSNIPTGPAQIPGGGVVTSLPPAQIKAMEEAGQQSGTQLAADRAKEANYAREVLPLEKVIPTLEKLGPTGTGPTTETLNEVRSALVSLGMANGKMVEDTKLFDEARKYLAQISLTGDPNTNDKLAAAFSANPNIGISQAANVDIAKSLLALRRLENAKVRAFEASGLPENQYAQFATQFMATQDPRAYGVDLMTPEAKKALYESLSPEDKPGFVASLKQAMALGLVKK